ncbi:2-hydroxyhepta-2,4-diene-1,7-dioate isomerase [Ensifer sp. T173]|jgi:2-keto-4-pentenoate hydratase/2-oxohepta-3-ene-1,7-dioic acid hydratase in catechol pathway|uniref:2-hydroxyhepta-2,4-diene-1,7-dioate isomerase n=1 Tax=Ensifer canadensis TaxID=555315 RepID=A0AAW4FS27_9HYPH|nr:MULTISPECIES: fumarylacetoacetate hydrolase family protein [Ensifer]MDP9633266.1 2-keto-4-pentenoate hydratase/2-oxohepta-3-ene-1,7-dioic acid hydratase in catechol pathway [Ensifer adhaerens]KQW73755.1 2-hydroxyhepta-2,4-diene-1,7-dioate isomerase [Ensifer sp. Root127]MBM3094109.1 2-hydroxyhepta-2,4-diene-1,7-dioate isomerase [Ensifer canadensis]NOV19585.1 FAA hydrolase family protein [Ensifer canadensis]UBI78255.1 fumarylacetoacetate hydrolase family protein [Ensifer canadensis]
MTLAKFASFYTSDGQGYGLVSDHGIIDLSRRYCSKWPTLREVIADGALTRLADEAATLAPDVSLADIRFEIPIPAPEKIICVGVNFPDRNEEYRDGQAAPPNPSLFIRFPRSFTGHGQPLIRPPESPQLDYEGEIVIVIGKGGRRIPEGSALDHIAALSLCNEGTIRDWVRHAKFNVTQGKNFDRTGSIGPWLVPFTDEAQIADIKLETRVNGWVRQQDRTSRMIFSFRKIINYVSTFTTLVPGDVIVTGTPTGAGARFDPPIWLKPGDVVEVEADGIGLLRNPIADEV